MLVLVGRIGGGAGSGTGAGCWMADVRRTGTGAAGVVDVVVGVEREGVLATGVVRVGAMVAGVGCAGVAGAGVVLVVVGAGVVLVVAGAGVDLAGAGAVAGVVVIGAGVVRIVAGVVVAAEAALVGASVPVEAPKFFSAAALLSAFILSMSSPFAAAPLEPKLPVRPWGVRTCVGTGVGFGLGAGGGVSFFLGRSFSISISFSLWMTLDESARRMHPLSGPLDASSVSITLFLSFFNSAFSSSSMAIDLLLPVIDVSSSSSPRRNLDLNLLDLPVPSSSSPV